MHRRCKSLIGVLCCSLICGSTPMVFASSFNGVNPINSVKEVKVEEAVISAPMLATIATLAVGSGVVLYNNDDIYDLGSMFYDYIRYNTSMSWSDILLAFDYGVYFDKSLNKVVVKDDFKNIVKGFLDNSFGNHDTSINSVVRSLFGVIGVHNTGYTYNTLPDSFNVGNFLFTYQGTFKDSVGRTYKGYSVIVPDVSIPNININGSDKIIGSCSFYEKSNTEYKFGIEFGSQYNSRSTLYLCKYPDGFLNNSNATVPIYRDMVNLVSITYNGGYKGDVIFEDNKDVSIYIPNNLSDIVKCNASDIIGDVAPSWAGDGSLTLPTVSNPSIQVDTSVSFPTDDKSLKTPVTLNQEATILDVVVPLSLPVSVDSEGVVTVADNVEVVNNSNGPIKISDVSIQSKDGWTLSDFDKDYSTERVGLKEFSFKIEGQEISNSITLNKVVNGLDKCSIDYDSRVAPQKDSISDSNIADIVFTIDWYEN